MPGLVGLVGVRASPGTAQAAAAALRHFPAYPARTAALAPTVAVAQVWRRADLSATDWAIERDAAVLVNGAVLEQGPAPRRVNARTLLDRYLERGTLEPRRLDGAFVLMIADLRRGAVTVCNDRIGTLPLYYVQTGDTVAFAPEAKALFAALGRAPVLSRTGIVNFLACGYCLDDTTLFEEIRFLTPGSALEIDVASAQCAVRRYWQIHYAPAKELTRRSAAEAALYDATRKAHELTVSDLPHGADLLLSGGWDSRGILAFLDAIGRPPRTAIAWGRTKDVPHSDPFIAESLARRYGVPFEFRAYDTDALPEHAGTWCHRLELGNDNIGCLAEGGSLLLEHYATSADVTLVGDEAWGWSGHPRTERAAREAVLPATLGREVLGCLKPAVREECRSLYEAQIDRVLAPCGNDHPADRRDFLYLHGRVARFIFALGYYKELVVEIRRPFLLAGVLDVMAAIPHRLRAEKNLYISMIARHFPEAAAFPLRRAESLPAWSYDLRMKPAVRDFFLDLLDESRLPDEVAALLDLDAFGELKRSFFDARPPAPSTRRARGSIGKHLPLRLRQRIRATGLYPGAHLERGAYPARGRLDLLRCVALLSLLERNFAAAQGERLAAGRSGGS